jgi:hypothetical protein
MSGLFAYGWLGVKKRKRYSNLDALAAKAIVVASDNPGMYDEFMEYMKGLIARKHAKKNRPHRGRHT